jgi:transcription elongation factor Elf1
MGRTNAARSQQKRERNAQKKKGTGKSQLKSNEKAQTVMCSICRQSFQCNAAEKLLRQHQENKHPKSKYEECFPPVSEN